MIARMNFHYTSTFLMLVLASVSGSALTCPKATKGSTLYVRFEATVSYVGNETLSQDDWNSVDETIEQATAIKYRSPSRKSPKEIVANLCHDGGIRRHLHLNDGGIQEKNLRAVGNKIRKQNLQVAGGGHHRGLQTQYSWSGSSSEYWDG